MKYKLTLLFFIFINSIAISQNLSNLDVKYGFNKFKLESSYTLHKNNLSYKTTDNNVKYYEYIGKDIKSVFGVKIDEIWLGYYKNRLYTISIDFGAISDSESQNIIKELKKMFGYQELITNSEGETYKYEWAIAWETQKTYLQANRMSCSFQFKPCAVSIFVNSKKIETEILNSKF
ncbi:hypothetical protein FEDK69T_12020 [Flavobacterium enshiense DK69]|uniref:Uridine kinase n=1 Tax=Flavobacterium enshiense DK69 TaxID=1107311 RepID=V6SC21_9FLAO|nr:hypothetical protein [Flavobacterium enshiense]ESU23792.1 hypothetical protein FEDK69T_12020 [Flavobacterium enshiense DK69]KGO96078.1 hypothetical protein Q767_07395 [Flavobacterium enshiense DK69]